MWTDRVGLPLALLCLEIKTIKSASGKLSGRFCALTDSSLKVASIMFLPFKSAV